MKELSQYKQSRLLSMFCLKRWKPVTPKNKHFRQPFEQGGIICVTDDQMLLKVDKRLIQKEYPNYTRPNIQSVVAKKHLGFIKISQIEECLRKANMDMTRFFLTCPECEGEKEVGFHYTDKEGLEHVEHLACPICNGSGLVENGITRSVRIAGRMFSAYNLLRLFKAMKYLGIQSASVSSDKHDEKLKFVLSDEADIFMQPMGDYSIADTGQTIELSEQEN